MFRSNHFKLGTFSTNCSGGMTVTKIPERWDATWDRCPELRIECRGDRALTESVQSQWCDRSAHLTRVDASKSKKPGASL
jgi:hypothetical protein